MKKHFSLKHNGEEIRFQFFDENNTEVELPILSQIDESNNGYKKWLAATAERIEEALHPALPGKFTLMKVVKIVSRSNTSIPFHSISHGQSVSIINITLYIMGFVLPKLCTDSSLVS